MKKLVKAIIVLLLVVLSVNLCFAQSVNRPELPRVVDKADENLFSDSEEASLNSMISQITDKYGFDVLIMTVNDHGDYADDEKFIEAVWDYNGFGVGPSNDGWAIVICMDCRSWYHSACGKASEYLTYDTVNIIDDFMQIHMEKGDFAGACKEALKQMDTLFEHGAKWYEENVYSPLAPDPKPEKETTIFDKLKSGGILGVIAGLISGMASKGSAQASMRSISNATSAGQYKVEGSFRITRAENILMNQYVQRTPKAQNTGGSTHHSSGSSYSAPHVSSGGNTHSGGGGRHF